MDVKDAQQAPSSDTTAIVRGRSYLMWHTLSSTSLSNNDDKQFTFQGNTYQIIDSNFRDWINPVNPRLVSICGNVYGREILLIDPARGILVTRLAEYAMRVNEKKLNVGDNLFNQIHTLLWDLTCFVGGLLISNGDEVTKIIETAKSTLEKCLTIEDKSVPCINIDTFLENRVGVCRHFSVLVCIFIAHVMNLGYLPQGEIEHRRMNVGSSAHATAHYTFQQWSFCIDPVKLFNPSTKQAALSSTTITLSDSNDSLPATLPYSPSLSPSPSNSDPSSQVC